MNALIAEGDEKRDKDIAATIKATATAFKSGVFHGRKRLESSGMKEHIQDVLAGEDTDLTPAVTRRSR